MAAVSSAALPGLGKVFRAEAVLAVPVARLHRELFEGIEQMPQWNPTLSQVKVRWGGMYRRQRVITSRADCPRLCIARVASIQKVIFIKAFKIAEGLKLIPHSCKSRISPQGEKMCFAGMALRNVSFPCSLFHTVPVHRGFSTLGDSDIAQTLISGEKLFRGIRQLKKKKRLNQIRHAVGGTPRKLMHYLGLLLSICLISQLPDHSISLSKLPASESLP